LLSKNKLDKFSQHILTFFGTQLLLKTGVINVTGDTLTIAVNLPVTYTS